MGDDSTILHYNGTDWSHMNSGTKDWLVGVWGSKGNDVFAVGTVGSILHYDGSSWSSMNSGTTRILWDIWGSLATDVFAVGDNGVILHYDGISPTTTTTTLPTTTISPPCTTESIYGEYSEETELLRYVHDNILSQAPAGREIIRLYYQWSPAIVRAMEEDEEFKEQVKEMVDGILELVGGE